MALQAPIDVDALVSEAVGAITAEARSAIEAAVAPLVAQINALQGAADNAEAKRLRQLAAAQSKVAELTALLEADVADTSG